MPRYKLTIRVSPVDGEYGEIEEATFVAGKQRCQNMIRQLTRMLAESQDFRQRRRKP